MSRLERFTVENKTERYMANVEILYFFLDEYSTELRIPFPRHSYLQRGFRQPTFKKTTDY